MARAEGGGVRPRKSLGQHFLHDRKLLERFADVAGVGPDDTVLEIGPGMGTLTEVLASRAGRVVAVEIDPSLQDALHDRLQPFSNVTLVWGDILELDLADLPALSGPYIRVVANLPYYITSPILRKLLSSDFDFQTVTVLVQKELAQRLAAPCGSKQYGSLSALCQVVAQPRLAMTVSPHAFVPPPHVDSALLHLDMRQPPLSREELRRCLRVIDTAFANRRKQLSSALPGQLGLPKPVVQQALQQAGIASNARAEQLDRDAFLALTAALL
jgi:16S rRNA (adenine1518-N6/adenine1519-N6)-dimethyltransferase